ncbi:hypothetical protein [Povalibacter sp.]|uniref:hypothetical protein n=1 Tax=Povalibacter sp. TaxID=1962978 RepID=UPI002F3F4C58
MESGGIIASARGEGNRWARITDTRNVMPAYTIVQAESHEAAATLFGKHPHFTAWVKRSGSWSAGRCWRASIPLVASGHN